VDTATVQLYDASAKDLASRYESADMSATHALLLRHLPKQGRVLEVGCGSGRDAAFLLSRGYDMTATDASANMVAEAGRRHPELAGRLQQAALPLHAGSPLLERPFDAVLAMAIMMHIADQELTICAAQFAQILRPGGILFVSGSVGREGLDAQRDAGGRLFIERSPAALEAVFQQARFVRAAVYDTVDALDRPVRWFSLVLRRGDNR
jgi:2-polyprenyl-3-methyl-5-hydroxy-6-metoxy-1,4-benzoquinol methylase